MFTNFIAESIDGGVAFAASSGTISLVDEDNKIAIAPVENVERELEPVFSDEDGENVGRTNKNDENTDDDDDLPLSKVGY